MRVAIIDPLGSPYDGSTIEKRGLGGSESAVISISRELAKLGVTVHVFCDCTAMGAKPGVYDGVRYWNRDDITIASPADYDVVISSRSVLPFTEHGLGYHLWKRAKHKVLWLHDTFCEGDGLLESMVVNGHIDEVWTLSDWHTSYISTCDHGHRRMMEVLKRKMWVTRNGVNLYSDYVDVGNKNRDHFVFNASVTKGMRTLLEDVWPKVHEWAPNAFLTVIGGAYPLKEADKQADDLAELTKTHDGKKNVKFTGIISQKEVARILADAAYMIYPQTLPETFGISTVESLAYGTPVISGRFGAMEETAVDDACYLMDYPVDSNVLYTFNRQNHIAHFVELVKKAYNVKYLWQQKTNKALAVREVCTWDKVALQWKQQLYKKLGLYLPVTEYREVQRINHRVHELFNKRWSNPCEWGYYPEIEKRIEVVVPFYNASQYVDRCIESIEAQNYENYRIHLIDDASTDGTWSIISEKYGHHEIYSNDENMGALHNQVTVIQDMDTDMDAIIILVDGDDALTNDPNIFKKINQLYHDGAEFTYGSCWSMADNIPLVAQEYPPDVMEARAYRSHKFAWNIPYTHLRTFKWSLFDSIDDSSLRDGDGMYFKAGGDGALFYALIERCEPKSVKVVRDVVYLYNDLNPINDYKVNGEEQTKNANVITSRKSTSTIKKILIAIPTAKNIHPETFKSIYNLKVPSGYSVHFQYFYGYRVDQVRNLIANWVVEGFDYLFAVDYDISFEPDALEKLLECDTDIASGIYIQRKPGKIVELFKSGNNLTPFDIKGTQPIEVDACGFGCALVKKEVFVKIGYPQFEYHPALRFEDTISEDVDFCRKAKEKGFSILAHPKVVCDHHGETVYKVFT